MQQSEIPTRHNTNYNYWQRSIAAAHMIRNVRITDKELEVLEIIHTLGPSSSEKVHESMNPRPDYLLVLRTLHGLVEKRFLQRIIINKKQFYKTSRQYGYIKGFLKNSEF